MDHKAENMNILLTGTQGYRRGFIANHFLDNYRRKYNIYEYAGDIRDWDQDLTDFDMVVHLAAMAGVRMSHKKPDLYWDVNVVASQKIFDSCVKYDVPIIYASSSSIYEWWLSPYAMTKWTMEHIAPDNSLGLRFHTVYGPNSREDMLYDMLQQGKVDYLTNHTRDWTHVADVCSAIDVCITEFDALKNHVAVDVGNGAPVSVVDMADKVCPGNDLPVVAVSGEREHTLADPTMLIRHGWRPMHHVLDD
jgi:nucleoside-diphosphate-sugar epimerase